MRFRSGTSLDQQIAYIFGILILSMLLITISPIGSALAEDRNNNQVSPQSLNPQQGSLQWVNRFGGRLPEQTRAGIYYSASSNEAANVSELKAMLGEQFRQRVTSCQVHYTGNIFDNVGADLQGALDALMAEDDYLHYSISGWKVNYQGYDYDVNITVTVGYHTTLQQEQYVDTQVASILNQIITTSMDNYRKERAIHDYIVTHVAYDTTYKNYSAYGALYDGVAVCQGYSLLAFKMLNECGIPVRIVEGTKEFNHAWNMVNPGTGWYHLDCTWDDPVPDVPNRITYTYYNKTNVEMSAGEDPHYWTVANYPAVSTVSYDQPPWADSVNVTGSATVGQDLSGNYLYHDYESQNESGTSFQWFRSAQSDGSNLESISGAAATTYRLSTSDSGKYIFFQVTPRQLEILAGNPVLSQGVGPVSGSEDEALVAADKDALSITFAIGDSLTSVTQNITLPGSGANGSNISWASDKPGVISTSGQVTRPAYGLSNETVTLTASLTRGTVTDSKTFVITVLAQTNQTGYLTANPTTVQDAVDINQTFTLTLKSGEFIDGITKDQITLQGDFSDLTVKTVSMISPDTIEVTISGDLHRNSGTGNITVLATGSTAGIDISVDILIESGIEECFIATAAFGSKFTWPVTLLRHFRDQYLLTNIWGTSFVKFYYRHSPPIAAIIAENEPLKILVQVLLSPVVALVYLLYSPPLLTTVSGLLILFLVLRVRARRERSHL